MGINRKTFLKKAGTGALTALSGTVILPLEKTRPPLIKPVALSRGDTIGMVSPASNLSSPEKYEKVVCQIEDLGFRVKVGEHAKDHFGYLAGTDKERAADLNAMFVDKEVDGIIPFRGGWGSNRILKYLDYDLIRQNPKPLIGFSDITSLLLAIYAKSGVVTYHGPVGKSEWTNFTLFHFKKAVMQTQPFYMKPSHRRLDSTLSSIYTIRAGKARGRLLGGNLSVLTSMIGSDYLPDWEGAILFIEDVGEAIYRIDRMMTQLKMSSILEKLNGLIFGQCSNCPVASGYHFTLEQILKNHLQDVDIPAFSGANIGHITNMFTLPIGVEAEIDAETGIIQLLRSPTKPNV